MLLPGERASAEPSAAVADETLVALAIDGDRDAFERLVRRHQRPLVNHLYRLTRVRELSFDLAQEVFLKVYSSLATFDFRYRFTTWLYRIASNCAIDHRRRRRPDTCSLDQPVPGSSLLERGTSLPGSEPGPDDVLQMREMRSRLEEAIVALPAAYRQLVLLRHRHHLRYEEISMVMGLPIGTVKNRIFRARKILREELAELLDGDV